MYCPQCGQQQVSDQLRFCSRCGFPLDGVVQLLGNGGVLPPTLTGTKGRNMTPRQLGIRHGVMLMMSTMLVVPVVALLSKGFHILPGPLIPLAALVCFVGGLLRLIYALLFEEDIPRVKPPPAPNYIPPVMPSQIGTTAGNTALPPAQGTPAGGWRPQRADTAELVRPPSVTENTTRLLDDKIDPNAR